MVASFNIVTACVRHHQVVWSVRDIYPMATHKVKIAARLRPKIQGELDDDSVQIHHPTDNTSGSSSSLALGVSYISVTNPRDPSQVFKFP